MPRLSHALPPQEGTNAKTQEMQPTLLHFPSNNKPVAPHNHGLTSSKPATKKQGHHSQTETGEHPEQPSNTCLQPVPETKSGLVYLR
ncbi:hypothetical protein E2C01_100952 [Portunus trituberculatus]|uniref:Uncharacterized protein n=1 Tax=Portunus trituberculatus TaxID=210409 RepID=A0A5B7K4G3_PORTR|nr:hypothetical protein [Portunus trituberculatus]